VKAKIIDPKIINTNENGNISFALRPVIPNKGSAQKG